MTISSVSAAQPVSNAPKSAAPKNPPAEPVAQKQDSVHLSAAAKNALADADHDGDSK